MRLVSFDPLRTLDIPGVTAIKPEHWFRARQQVMAADWLLFPEYWQVNALHYSWKKNIFPSISSYHLGHDKIEMSRAFEATCPAHVPQTRILAASETAEQQILDEFCFPLVAKEVRSAMGQGVHLLPDRAALRRYIACHPVLYIQEYLPIDRDLRVVVIGSQVVAAYWRIAAEGNFHTNVARGGMTSFEHIPPAAIRLVESVARELNIDHAGFDVAVVDGWCYLFEFNVRFGNQALNAHGIKTGPLILQTLHERSPSPLQPGTPLLPRTG